MSLKCPECGKKQGDNAPCGCECGKRANRENSVEQLTYSQGHQDDHGTDDSGTVAARATWWRKWGKHREPLTPKVFLKRLALLFLVINVVMYASVLGRRSIGRPHPVGKAYMSAALVTSMIYYCPLARVIGPDTFPANLVNKLVRFLEKRGDANFPEKDAESALWSVLLYKLEWANVYSNEFERMSNGSGRLGPEKFMRMTDKLYGYIESLATNPLADSQFHKKRIFQFVGMANNYLTQRYNVFVYVGTQSSPPPYHLHNDPYIANEKEIERCRQILAWFDLLKSYSKENEKDGYFNLTDKNESTWWVAEKLVFESTENIVSNMIVFNKLDCNSKYINMNSKSRNVLLDDALGDSRIKLIDRDILHETISTDVSVYIFNKINERCR